MNEKCKYCDYVSKCSRFCEYNSIMCLMHRSFPKIVDKTYEELEKENKEYKEQLETSEKARKEAIELINNINDWEICSKYDCMYKDDVLDVLRMLDIDKGE